MTDYTWNSAGFDPSNIDGIEVAGIFLLEGSVPERNDANTDSPYDYFSIYVYRTNQGVERIADRNTYHEALDFADRAADRFSVPIEDFVHNEKPVVSTETAKKTPLLDLVNWHLLLLIVFIVIGPFVVSYDVDTERYDRAIAASFLEIFLMLRFHWVLVRHEIAEMRRA